MQSRQRVIHSFLSWIPPKHIFQGSAGCGLSGSVSRLRSVLQDRTHCSRLVYDLVAMPPTRTGELSASMAILCLVVQQPDTVASVGLRLTETFPHARWSRNAAHGNLPSLAKQGL